MESKVGRHIDEIARALVRPIVTVTFAGAFVVYTWTGLISGEVFSAVAGAVIAFWFSTRNQDNQDTRMIQALTTRARSEAPDVIMNIDRPETVRTVEPAAPASPPPSTPSPIRE